jgi:hypothetical protein
LLRIIKRPKEELVFTCDCGVTWKNSWLEPQQISDGDCPSCHRKLNFSEAEVLHKDKLRTKVKVSKKLGLLMELNNAQAELEEKYRRLDRHPSQDTKQIITEDIIQVQEKIFNLRSKLLQLKE